MASGTYFEFKSLKSEASKLKLTIGGQKGATIVCEVNNLETAIRENNISAFDEAYKSIDKLISQSKTKAKTFVAVFSELRTIVDKGRGRGNPMHLIKIEGERPETGRQVRDGQSSRNQGSLLQIEGQELAKTEEKLKTAIAEKEAVFRERQSIIIKQEKEMERVYCENLKLQVDINKIIEDRDKAVKEMKYYQLMLENAYKENEKNTRSIEDKYKSEIRTMNNNLETVLQERENLNVRLQVRGQELNKMEGKLKIAIAEKEVVFRERQSIINKQEKDLERAYCENEKLQVDMKKITEDRDKAVTEMKGYQLTLDKAYKDNEIIIRSTEDKYESEIHTKNNYLETVLQERDDLKIRLKRERLDVQMFVEESNYLLLEIQSIVMNEPFFFTAPRCLDREAVIKNISYIDLHPVKTGIAWIRQCLEENRKCFPERFVKYEMYSALQENQHTLQHSAKVLEAEKLDLSDRLSKVAGARLTDSNSNIADLSDPNRVTKLGEHYSELYDSQWTDAFDDLDLAEGKDRIAFLLNILVGSYKACADISVFQQRALKQALVYPSGSKAIENRKKVLQTEKDEGLSNVQSRALAELRMQCADLSAEGVRKHITMEHQDWFKSDSLENYTANCIDLCWLMHVQSPPIFIDTKMKSGIRFDSNMYKVYTKNGNTIDFVVWPALLLHEGGSVLSKGVAQLK